MAAISGKDGKVLFGSTQLAHVTGFTYNPTSNNPAFASSDTSGYKTRVAGVKDGSGSFDYKLDTSDKITDTLTEGSTGTLKLYVNGTLYFSVPAIIDALRIEVDVNEGEVVGGSVDFSGTGQPTYI